MENKSSPKDVFLHLLAMLALYVSAISFITLYFQYINVLVPDPLDQYSYLGVSGPIRWSMASLMIIFPVYIWVSRLLRKDYALFPEKKDLKIRKWLVYLTLFIAGLVIIGDLVSLIYNFLGGDVTLRFALKIAVILFVTGQIFWYYLWELKEKWSVRNIKIVGWGLSLLVAASIIAGFFTVGSPLRARQYRFDTQRVNDLSSLQWQIISYWQTKDALPATLDDLRDSISGFMPPLDPATRQAYGYEVKGSLQFELCANFDLPSADDPRTSKPASLAYPYEGYEPESWDHAGGTQCFERTIDPDRWAKEKMLPR